MWRIKTYGILAAAMCFAATTRAQQPADTIEYPTQSNLAIGGEQKNPTQSYETAMRLFTQQSAQPVQDLTSLAFENPAVKQWQYTDSRSSVEAQMSVRHEANSDHDPYAAINPQLGDHDRTFSFHAQTYMKWRSSTLWGEARYDNGIIRHIRWNETSEPQMVYPYLLADSVVTGDMKTERYSFAGGYADHNARLAWGAAINYTAGLYYRNVDPRPRNVTGNLNISAGIGLKLLRHYLLAASVNFRKYKQTNDVTFYSELGNEKIFHLTGLTNDYGRFAGTGYSSYYNGYRWGASLNLHPTDHRGLSASVAASRFAFNNILTALNKLPMARVIHTELQAEMAWLTDRAAVRASLLASRRIGRENIFGDAAASVYPQIGSNDMWHENHFRTSLDAAIQILNPNDKISLNARPYVAYDHLNRIYADPQCRWLINEVQWGAKANATFRLRRFVCDVAAAINVGSPIKSELTYSGVKDELGGLQTLVQEQFLYASHTRWQPTIGITAHYALSRLLALRLRVQAATLRATEGMRSNTLLVTAGVAF